MSLRDSGAVAPSAVLTGSEHSPILGDGYGLNQSLSISKSRFAIRRENTKLSTQLSPRLIFSQQSKLRLLIPLDVYKSRNIHLYVVILNLVYNF